MGRKNRTSQVGARGKNHQRNQSQARELDELVDKLLRLSTKPQEQNVQESYENQKEILTITEKIKVLENNDTIKGSAGNRTSGATIECFTNWALDNGALLNGCSIHEFKGFELGIRADIDIKESSLVIAVPHKIMMTIENAKASQLQDLIKKDKILSSMTNVTLAIFLLLEKFNKESFWQPYINILPKTYTTVLYFNMEELAELKSSPTLEMALKQIKSISRQYAYFHKIFATLDLPVCKHMKKYFTFEEYCWAVSTVMTRQNTIPFQGNDVALIPLWDMCNHTNGTISTAYNPALDRSECLALRDFKADEQLFIFYGSRSNADFFIHNGFIFEDNEYDVYWLHLGVSKSDPLREKRNQLLAKLAISSTVGFSIKKGAIPINGQLLAFLRIFNMNEEQLNYWMESSKVSDLEYLECALEKSLENKCWGFLETRLKLLLGTYKTTLEDDERMITEMELTSNQLLAIRMRVSEKRIIKNALNYVEQCMNQ